MRHNHTVAKLRAGGVALGPIVVHASPDLAERAAHMGFDWIWLDWQHGEWTESSLKNALARFLCVDATPVVRVKGHDPGTINHILDMGAMGVMVPMVQNAAEARAAADAVYYPPLGKRSGGGNRLPLIAGPNGPSYYDSANEQMLLVVQVETEEAVANVEEIMNVPGIGAVLVGPGDLMIDVKARGGGPARHDRLVRRVIEASKKTGTPAGCFCADPQAADLRVAQGFTLIGCCTTQHLLDVGLRQLLDHAATW